MSKRYRIRLSCHDCTGQDFQGCFDGGTELVDETFETVEAANAYAESKDWSGPWEWEIEEEIDD